MAGPDPNAVDLSNGLLERLYQAMRKTAQNMAPHFAPGFDAKDLDPDEVEMLWNRRHLTLEQEWELWRAVGPDGISPAYTPEQIGDLVFRDRGDLIKRGGRIEPKEQILWANAQARRMAKKRQQQQEQTAFTMPPEGMV